LQLGDRQIAPGAPPYIIAELGVNHDGSVDRAIELAHAAKRAGADAIKLQLFQTDLLLSRAAKLAAYQKEAGASDPFEMLRKLELDVQSMRGVVNEAVTLQLGAIVTVFSVELAPAAGSMNCVALKTASPDVVNRPLIEALMSLGKPLLVSAGAATLAEIAEASRWLEKHPHILMQCVSAYPTPDDCAALAGRTAMAEVNPNALGYSDHTTSIDTGALAVASGACMLEKHFTYDRAAVGPDHAASLNPEEFNEYVRLAHRAHAMLGAPRKAVLDIERDVRDVSRQSLTFTRSLNQGHVLHRTDITVKRPGSGISPARLAEFIGQTLTTRVEADMPIHEHHFSR
jgi:N,N'-diacetyllegionaminate synthase